jgi:hypothetical protein
MGIMNIFSQGTVENRNHIHKSYRDLKMGVIDILSLLGLRIYYVVLFFLDI